MTSTKTIGQFYEVLKQGLRNLSVTLGESNAFYGDRAWQLTNEHLYSGGGRIIAVDNLATAVAALDEIVEQGKEPNISKFGMETAILVILPLTKRQSPKC